MKKSPKQLKTADMDRTTICLPPNVKLMAQAGAAREQRSLSNYIAWLISRDTQQPKAA